MKGDFSRITFDAAKHFSRVLMQQGRVTIDADPNEQAAILLHYVRTLARDLIGPCGGPIDALGFQLTGDPADKPTTLKISAGRYYVDGILCENAEDCTYDLQPDYPVNKADDALLLALKSPTPSTAFWLYLDVWERHITPIEDDQMREVALGGPDTCTRAKVIWQVKALDPTALQRLPEGSHPCTDPLALLPTVGAAQMAAELDPGQQIKDPCVVAPDARYRGAENLLYRVEIHSGSNDKHIAPTFKWSRDNGSVATAWLRTEGNDLIVASARGFSAGAWVELSDDRQELLGEPGVLVKLTSVDGNRLSVDPSSVPSWASLAWTAGLQSPKVRRWDQTENDDIELTYGAISLFDAIEPNWVDLEDGLRVQFKPSVGDELQYRSGDYWLIPARVATGDIEWPRTNDAAGGSTADFQPPHGIEHHYAPLGRVQWNSDTTLDISTCLCTLQDLAQCAMPGDAAITRSRPQPQPKAPPAPAPARAPASVPKPPGPKPK